ncbi:MAG TPA: c-type cytochrome [Burkholderiales bacterium]|nr:c-type cytochrome [Burkholderiales bacterium]
MKNLIACTMLALLLAGCNEKPAPTQTPTPQTSSAEQAMQASKQEATAAVESAKQAASSAAAATKDVATAAATATENAARQATDKLTAESQETAGKATEAAKEAAHQAATATEGAAKQVAAATAPPTAIPDWVVMPKYDCRACHALDHKLVGPAWKDVAERYKGDATAEAKLMDKVKKGGRGNWIQQTGGVSMPPHPNLSDDDLRKVVDFILSLAK